MRKETMLDRKFRALQDAILQAVHDDANAVVLAGKVHELRAFPEGDLEHLYQVLLDGDKLVSIAGSLADKAAAAAAGLLGPGLIKWGLGIQASMTKGRVRTALKRAKPEVGFAVRQLRALRSTPEKRQMPLPESPAAARRQGMTLPPLQDKQWEEVKRLVKALE